MRFRSHILVNVLLCLCAVANCAEPTTLFNLHIGGGFPDSSQLNIDLFPDGRLIATLKGRPITTAGRLTTSQFDKALAKLEVQKLLHLAKQAASVPPTPKSGQVDFKWAGFGFRLAGKAVSCPSGPETSKWAANPKVRALIIELDSILPKPMHFDTVLSE